MHEQNEKMMKDFYHALRPAAWIYSSLMTLRNKLFDWGILPSERFSVPVISVGNLAVGGTGKTPHVEYLVRLLRPERRVAVLSRGYGRKSHGFVLANCYITSRELGDEPFQIWQKFPDILVAVDANRRRGIRQLLSIPPDLRPEVVILDDAFQHRYVKPAFSILLTDCHRLFSRDFVLPEGRLREPKQGAARADAVIITKCLPSMEETTQALLCHELGPWTNGAALYWTTLEYGKFLPVFPDHAPDLPQGMIPPQGCVLLLTGIANPRPLEEKLRKITPNITSMPFPDHHNYSSHDLRRIETAFRQITAKKKYIVTTEKDAARLQATSSLPEALKSFLYYIPITIRFLGNGENEFVKHLKQIIG